MTSSKLTIQLLGGFSLMIDDTPVSGLPSRKAEALVAYLACHERPFPRELLADFLWDDRPQEQALANLRSLLSGLRRKLKPYLLITRQTIGFNHDSHYHLDVAEFINCHAICSTSRQDVALLQTAVSHYKGHLLEGFHIRESRRFEEWMSLERERLQRLAINLMQQLVTTLLNQGNYAAGIEHAVRLLEYDSLSEQAHRQLMLLFARSGQRPAALQQYDVCCHILDTELGVPPASETTALYERIRSSQAVPLHNLPPTITPFVGRETELAQLRRMLAGENGRFLTILGPGGIGKTRLALHIAGQIITNQPGMFLHGIRIISLQSISDAQFLLTKIGEGLSFSFNGTQSPQTQLLNYLRQKEMLLILDNFEQLLDKPSASLQILNQILQQAPLVKLLITSRTRLGLPGEHVFDMRGLTVPPEHSPVPAQTYSAVQLFIQSAQRIQHDFTPTAKDLTAVTTLCYLLDGLPLGIELAASWVRSLSCTEIVDGVIQGMDFLKEGSVAGPDRHASLRAVFTYSWRLLDEKAQHMLKQLTVFQNGFSRKAAQAITKIPMPLLAELIDHSWLQRTKLDQTMRYEMLTVNRQYATEKLMETASLPIDVRQHHLDYFAAFLQERLPILKGGNQQKALQEISTEIENIRYALNSAIETKNFAAIDRCLEALFHFYDTRSWFQEGAELFSRCIQAIEVQGRRGEGEKTHPPPPSRTLAHILARLQGRTGWFLFHLGKYEQSRHLLQQSLDSLSQVNAPTDQIFSLNYLGAITRHLAEYAQAEQYLQDALTLARAADDPYGASIAFNILGQIAWLEGDFDAARQYCHQGLTIKRDIGDQRGMTYSLTYLGRVERAVGNLAEAQALFRESMTISELLGDKRGVAFALQNLGQTVLTEANFEVAYQLYRQSLDMSREIGDRLGEALTLVKLGSVKYQLHDFVGARRFLVEALQEGLDIGSIPAMLEGVLETAVLHIITAHIANSDLDDAAKRLRYVQHHSSSSQAQKEAAEEHLKQMEEEAVPASSRGHTVLTKQPPIDVFVTAVLKAEQALA